MPPSSPLPGKHTHNRLSEIGLTDLSNLVPPPGSNSPDTYLPTVLNNNYLYLVSAVIEMLLSPLSKYKIKLFVQ